MSDSSPSSGQHPERECTSKAHVWVGPVYRNDPAWEPEGDQFCTCGVKSWAQRNMPHLSGYKIARPMSDSSPSPVRELVKARTDKIRRVVATMAAGYSYAQWPQVLTREADEIDAVLSLAPVAPPPQPSLQAVIDEMNEALSIGALWNPEMGVPKHRDRRNAILVWRDALSALLAASPSPQETEK